MTYPSTEGCKWVFSRGPKPPALVGKRVSQCRLHSFTMGLPHIQAYTIKNVVHQSSRERKHVNCFSRTSTQKCHVLPPLTFSWLKKFTRSDPISKEQVNATWPCAQRKGTGIPTCPKDYQTCLHTSEGLWGSNEPRHGSVFKNCKRSTTVSSFIEYHTTENIQDLCHTETE